MSELFVSSITPLNGTIVPERHAEVHMYEVGFCSLELFEYLQGRNALICDDKATHVMLMRVDVALRCHR